MYWKKYNITLEVGDIVHIEGKLLNEVYYIIAKVTLPAAPEIKLYVNGIYGSTKLRLVLSENIRTPKDEGIWVSLENIIPSKQLLRKYKLKNLIK